MFLGDKPSIPVLISLLPIVAGVGMASMSEVRLRSIEEALGSREVFEGVSRRGLRGYPKGI